MIRLKVKYQTTPVFSLNKYSRLIELLRNDSFKIGTLLGRVSQGFIINFNKRERRYWEIACLHIRSLWPRGIPVSFPSKK
jgi:hypothetical protein